MLPLLLCLLFLGNATEGWSTPLSAAEERGRVIYFKGVDSSGTTVDAYFGEDHIHIPAEISNCATCHGHDGTGRPESGVIPTDITWPMLTKSYGHTHRAISHGPFDEQSLRHYLRSGEYPGGATGDPSMPRYDFSDQDLDDLIAFLHRLGTINPPGVSDSSISLGLIYVDRGTLGERGREVAGMLGARFTSINRQGGLHGRQLVLKRLPLRGEDQADKILDAWLEQNPVLAVISPLLAGDETEWLKALSEREIPTLAPLTLRTDPGWEISRTTFFLMAGLPEQSEALLRYSPSQNRPSASSGVAVIYTRPEFSPGKRLKRACKQLACGEYSSFLWDGKISPKLIEKPPGKLIFLGFAEELLQFEKQASRAGLKPRFFVSGSLCGSLAAHPPAQLEGRLTFSFPLLQRDLNPEAAAELKTDMAAANLHHRPGPALLNAAAGSKLLVNALRKTGRQLDRASLLATLQSTFRFKTGLLPPLTYSINRRVGSRGSYLASVNKDGLTVLWQELP